MREKVYCNQLFYENLKRPIHFDIFALMPLYGVRFFLELTCQIWCNHLCQFVTNLPSLWKPQSNTFFWKILFLLCSLVKYFIVLSRNYCEGDSAFFFATWSSLHVLSRTYQTFVFVLQARQTGVRGKAPTCLPRGKATLSLFENLRNLQAKQCAIPKTSCMFMICYENTIIIILASAL